MSATGRGAERSPSDYYATPRFCINRLLEAVSLPGGWWLDPGAGDGAIIRAVNSVRSDVRWMACEIRPECRPFLNGAAEEIVIGDFLAGAISSAFVDVVIANPPFTEALAFVRRAMSLAPWVVILERVNWLASDERCEWLRAHAPDVYVLPDRPSFTGSGTDATDYCWMAWPPGGHNRTAGELHVLRSTPLAERKADPRQMALFDAAQLKPPPAQRDMFTKSMDDE